jgi:putative NADPH-quinone reductase
MRICIVHAHREPATFNGAMTQLATAALAAAGHEVFVSDFYAMRFNPASDRRNFATVKNPGRLKQQDGSLAPAMMERDGRPCPSLLRCGVSDVPAARAD